MVDLHIRVPGNGQRDLGNDTEQYLRSMLYRYQSIQETAKQALLYLLQTLIQDGVRQREEGMPQGEFKVKTRESGKSIFYQGMSCRRPEAGIRHQVGIRLNTEPTLLKKGQYPLMIPSVQLPFPGFFEYFCIFGVAILNCSINDCPTIAYRDIFY